MATGILGQNALAASTDTTVYTVPAATFSIVTINVTNRNATSRNVRIALAASGTPSNEEYIEYDTELLGHGTLERGGIVVDAGKNIVVQASGTDVTAVCYGIETATS
jgi:hypothetical protein|tara:strand:- start:11848 stop:12168 length:321 start_codon:yes stop_codon:yes gene_type:complete